MAEKEENVFFVGIREPNQVRRAILESSKDSLHALQQYERFKAVRIEKTKEILRLKRILKETDNLMVKLKAKLPKTSIRVKAEKASRESQQIIPIEVFETKKLHRKNDKKSVKNKEVSKPVFIKPRRLTEVEKLESELNDIEKKLGDIG